MKILSAVKHKNIVEFFYTEEGHNTLLLFLEYMEGVNINSNFCYVKHFLVFELYKTQIFQYIYM